MKKDEIIRAWRDPDYFFSLSDDQRAGLPANPAGMVELSEDALLNVMGASHGTCYQSCHFTAECCTCPGGSGCCYTDNCDTCYTSSICCC